MDDVGDSDEDVRDVSGVFVGARGAWSESSFEEVGEGREGKGGGRRGERDAMGVDTACKRCARRLGRGFEYAKRSVLCISIRLVDICIICLLLGVNTRVATLLYEVPPSRGRRVPRRDYHILSSFDRIPYTAPLERLAGNARSVFPLVPPLLRSLDTFFARSLHILIVFGLVSIL